MRFKFLKTLLVEIGLIALLVGGYFMNDIWGYFSKKELIYTPADKNCSLNRSPCSLALQDGSKLTVEIMPKAIFPLQKNEFVALIEGADLVKMTVFSLNMSMGIHEFSFQKEKDGLFRASILLPACSSSMMKWQADVKVEKKGKLYGGGFLFESKN